MNSNNIETQWQVNKSDFLAILGEEFMKATGYGVYAHLSHIDIDHLFNSYLEQNLPVRIFVRGYARTF